MNLSANIFFSLVLSSVLASSMARAQCDQRLEHNLTRGTLRLFERGVIGTSEISEMVNSATPINPLRARTLGSRDSAAGHFFKAILDGRIDPEQWQRIRRELRTKLADLNVQIQTSDRAREETAEVASLTLVNSNESVIDFLNKWSGVYYFEIGPGAEHLLRSALKREPIWKGEVGPKTYETFSEVNGKPVFNLLTQVPTTFRQKLTQGFHTQVLRKMIDLETGKVTDSIIWQWRKQDNIANLQQLVFKADRMSTAKLIVARQTVLGYNYRIRIFENGEEREEPWSRLHFKRKSLEQMNVDWRLLANGKLAVTAYDLNLENSKTEEGKIQFAMTGTTPMQLSVGEELSKQTIFESKKGRVFVGAASWQNNVPHLQIFEPLKSSEPIFDFSGPDLSPAFEYDFFERKGVLYLALGQGSLGAVYLFAPLRSHAPVMQMSVEPFRSFRAAVGPDGEPYVILQRNSVDAYSIFWKASR